MRVKAHPFLLLTLTVLFWSGNFVMGRAVNNSVPPISLAFWRWVLALLILLPFSIPHLRAQWPMVRQNFSLLAVYGVLGVSLFNTFVYISLHYTTATNALLINSIVPILIVLISYLQGVTQVSVRQIFGIAMSLTGVLTIICRADPSVLLMLQVNRGDLWILLAVVCWSLYTILLRKRPPDLHPLSFLASIVAIGMVPLTMLYIWEFSRIGGFDVNLVTSSSILYMALFPSVLCFIFWNQAVREVGPDKAGLFLYLMPVFGAILSAVFLGESISAFHLIGSVLIFAGIHLTTRVPR
jgi:drug/metabolite transporter (DMT)-like permease